jgi:hypothetical protein
MYDALHEECCDEYPTIDECISSWNPCSMWTRVISVLISLFVIVFGIFGECISKESKQIEYSLFLAICTVAVATALEFS